MLLIITLYFTFGLFLAIAMVITFILNEGIIQMLYRPENDEQARLLHFLMTHKILFFLLVVVLGVPLICMVLWDTFKKARTGNV